MVQLGEPCKTGSAELALEDGVVEFVVVEFVVAVTIVAGGRLPAGSNVC